jgi:NAD(P)-dependent dehydrogenase (short-subunit alcohol dehydrogenase family)
MDLDGAVAVVTGAAGGIGRCTVAALRSAGAKVCAVDYSTEALARLAEELDDAGRDVLTLEVDVTKPDQIEQMYRKTSEHFGRIDIVHNNAGILGGPQDWPDIEIETIGRLVDVNLMSVLVSCRLGVDFLQPSGGVIINTSSKTAFHPGPILAVYATTKAAVAFFTQSCARLAETHGIRVNAVLPAASNTALLRVGGQDSPLVGFLEGRVNPQRLVPPERVAAVVVELCRDDSKAGECVVVDSE